MFKKKLVSQDTLFFDLAEASPTGIYIVQDAVFSYANSAFSALTGFSASDIKDSHWLSLVFEEDKDHFREAAARMLKAGGGAPYEYRVKTKEGPLRWLLETVTPVEIDGPAVIGTCMDFTERKEKELEVRDRARHDHLTGLLNQATFLEELYASVALHSERQHWLVFADVDGLKEVNDRYGHLIGDLVLKAVAAALDRPGVTAARYGGDEFVAFFAGRTRTGPEEYCAEVQADLANAPVVDFRTKDKIRPALTMGIARFPEDASSVSGLIRAADDSLYAARALSREAGLDHGWSPAERHWEKPSGGPASLDVLARLDALTRYGPSLIS